VVYLPLAGPKPDSWRVSTPAYVLRSARAESIASEVRGLVREVAPEAPVYRTYTLAELARRSMLDLSFTLLLLAIASGLALLLGAVGLYGVLSYVVAERTREIGVRMALGARAGQVRRMIVADGIAIGLVASVASMRALAGLLFGVETMDVATYLVMSASMIVVGLLASYLPAHRASRVAPMVSLKEE
jgi:ABC-type lipoprotein release transport system permease subunit